MDWRAADRPVLSTGSLETNEEFAMNLIVLLIVLLLLVGGGGYYAG